ncbi:hypothetical protein LU699_05450 [Luteimonas fraxinea]|uniref:hypothetical protein n=1 Tax=Luteimonas fraxinea TaxID=2901869 RepID=UPI001E2EDBFD|nr:hypothetical protein [Luteimonas fraxinea]MCD9124224.1 hypothetical protein [Luteimonas fraxinea]UHH11166.1 hypothetical protein LU699_05450 [Luteimonas fraxinea]
MGAHITIGASGPDLPTLFIGACAVIAAIAVPYFQRQAQIRDDKAQQDALRHVMRHALRQPVGTFADRCRALADNMRDDSWRARRPPKTLFRRPPEFDQFRPHLHLLGEIGTLVNAVVSDQNNAWLIVKALRVDDGLNDQWLSSMADSLIDMARRAERCKDLLQLEPEH